MCAKSWRHSTWRPSLSCSLTTNWFHVFSGCKVFLKTRAAEKTCNQFCVCVHLHFKLASPHVAAIFLLVISCRIGVRSIRLLSLFQDSCGWENPKPISCFFIIIGWFSVKEIQSDLHSGVHWQNHVAEHGTALSADHCLSTRSPLSTYFYNHLAHLVLTSKVGVTARGGHPYLSCKQARFISSKLVLHHYEISKNVRNLRKRLASLSHVAVQTHLQQWAYQKHNVGFITAVHIAFSQISRI